MEIAQLQSTETWEYEAGLVQDRLDCFSPGALSSDPCLANVLATNRARDDEAAIVVSIPDDICPKQVVRDRSDYAGPRGSQ